MGHPVAPIPAVPPRIRRETQEEVTTTTGYCGLPEWKIPFRGVMIPLLSGSESGSEIIQKLEIQLRIRIRGGKHNTLLGVMIPLFNGYES